MFTCDHNSKTNVAVITWHIKQYIWLNASPHKRTNQISVSSCRYANISKCREMLFLDILNSVTMVYNFHWYILPTIITFVFNFIFLFSSNFIGQNIWLTDCLAVFKYYCETCLIGTSLRPAFMFRIDRHSVYTG